MADYYALYGVFASSREPQGGAAPLLLVDADRPVEPVIFLRGNPAIGPTGAAAFPGMPVPAATRQPFQHGSGRLEMAQAIASARQPADGARVGQSRLAASVRPGTGRHAQRLRHPQRSAQPSRAAGLAGRRVHRARLVDQVADPADRAFQVYRQASDDRPECREADPENRLLWRMNRRRLDLEALRDSLLVAAGRLDRRWGALRSS